MPPVIDAHAHFLPEPIVAALHARLEAPDIRAEPGGGESFGIYRTRMPYGRAYDDLDARLARMEALGVDRQILSLPGLFGIQVTAEGGIKGIDGLHVSNGTCLARMPERD